MVTMEDILMPKYDEASIRVPRINEYLKSKEQLRRANVITEIAKNTGYRSLKIEGKSRAVRNNVRARPVAPPLKNEEKKNHRQLRHSPTTLAPAEAFFTDNFGTALEAVPG